MHHVSPPRDSHLQSPPPTQPAAAAPCCTLLLRGVPAAAAGKPWRIWPACRCPASWPQTSSTGAVPSSETTLACLCPRWVGARLVGVGKAVGVRVKARQHLSLRAAATAWTDQYLPAQLLPSACPACPAAVCRAARRPTPWRPWSMPRPGARCAWASQTPWGQPSPAPRTAACTSTPVRALGWSGMEWNGMALRGGLVFPASLQQWCCRHHHALPLLTLLRPCWPLQAARSAWPPPRPTPRRSSSSRCWRWRSGGGAGAGACPPFLPRPDAPPTIHKDPLRLICPPLPPSLTCPSYPSLCLPPPPIHSEDSISKRDQRDAIIDGLVHLPDSLRQVRARGGAGAGAGAGRSVCPVGACGGRVRPQPSPPPHLLPACPNRLPLSPVY